MVMKKGIKITLVLTCVFLALSLIFFAIMKIVLSAGSDNDTLMTAEVFVFNGLFTSYLGIKYNISVRKEKIISAKNMALGFGFFVLGLAFLRYPAYLITYIVSFIGFTVFRIGIGNQSNMQVMLIWGLTAAVTEIAIYNVCEYLRARRDAKEFEAEENKNPELPKEN